ECRLFHDSKRRETMCSPVVMHRTFAGLSRRELLTLGASAAAGVFAFPGRAAGIATTSRTIGIGQMVDLTHTLSPKFPVFPVPGLTFPMKITPIATVEQKGFYANKWEMIEHTGTHIDAPCHFIAQQLSVEQLPLESLLAPLAVIDLAER